MTDAAPDDRTPLRRSIAAIDDAHPLRTPLHYDQSKIGPRIDRLDAKASYYADSMEHLEQRIAALERRLAAGA